MTGTGIHGLVRLVATTATATLVFCSLALPGRADQSEGAGYAIPAVDAPELARLGPHEVGYTVITLVDHDRPDLRSLLAGASGVVDRHLDVHLWYPGVSAGGEERPARYSGRLPFRPDGRPHEAPDSFEFTGIAKRDAAVAGAGRYPLVLVSHGYQNWPAHLSYLTENLASKGYVVAAIDHGDLPFDSHDSFAVSLADAVSNRARDQRFVSRRLRESGSDGPPVLRVIRPDGWALIGYSLGGFGAVASAGAGYDEKSPPFTELPAGMLSDVLEHAVTGPLPDLRAAVLLAPWGGGPGERAWTAAAVARIDIPLLIVAGDADHVSDFDGGIRWLFETAVSAERYLLVYENARHNIGGNPLPAVASDYFGMREFFGDPVWRKDRIMGINQHFVTAFIDLYLKGLESRLEFLDVAPVRARDGEWPLPPGGYTGAAYSKGKQGDARYWKGFQRRFALGLAMHHREPGDTVE